MHALRLAYRPPYDFHALLGFFARRAIAGVEEVDEHAYRRVFEFDGKVGSLRVAAVAGTDALALQVDFPDRKSLPQIATRVRRLFDLDADSDTINAHLGRRAPLRHWVARHPGLRLPGGWDGFEIAVRAVLGQQISVAAARTLTERLVRRFGVAVAMPKREDAFLFPLPQALAEANLGGLGITGARINTLRAVAQAIGDGRVDFCADQTLDDFVQKWTALPGIGAWTAHYIALRALGHADAFPAADIVLRKAVARDGVAVSVRTLERMAERWRPYRAYAVMHLWRSTMV